MLSDHTGSDNNKETIITSYTSNNTLTSLQYNSAYVGIITQGFRALRECDMKKILKKDLDTTLDESNDGSLSSPYYDSSNDVSRAEGSSSLDHGMLQP